MKTVRPEKMWIIIGWCGIYTDTALTRNEMIAKHTSALGKSWAYCRRQGDRAIKAMICPILKRKKQKT